MILRLTADDVSQGWWNKRGTYSLKPALLGARPILSLGDFSRLIPQLYLRLIGGVAQAWLVYDRENGDPEGEIDFRGCLVTFISAEDMTENRNLVVYTVGAFQGKMLEPRHFKQAAIALEDFRASERCLNIFWYPPSPESAEVLRGLSLEGRHIIFSPFSGNGVGT